MVSDSVVEAILPKLTTSQVNWLWMSNRKTSKYITEHRHQLPGTQVDQLFITKPEQNKIFITYLGRELFIEIQEPELQFKLLGHLKPLSITCANEKYLPYLSDEWLAEIEKIHLWRLENEESCQITLKKLKKCSSIFLEFSDIFFDADMVLQSMPFVVGLAIHNFKFSPSFFENLIHKSKIGAGIKTIHLDKPKDEVINPDQFIEFIKNAKFQPVGRPFLYIGQISGAAKDFKTKILRLKELDGWNFLHVSEPIREFEIATQTSIIFIVINEFIE